MMQVLFPDTGTINTQFHVAFDDWFTTVATSVDDFTDFNTSAWSKMFGDSEYHFIRDEDDTQVDPEDSMTSEAITNRQNQVSKAMDATMPLTPLPVSPPPSSLSMPSHPPSPVQSSPHLQALLPLLCLPFDWCITSSSAPEGENTLASVSAAEGALKD